MAINNDITITLSIDAEMMKAIYKPSFHLLRPGYNRGPSRWIKIPRYYDSRAWTGRDPLRKLPLLVLWYRLRYYKPAWLQRALLRRWYEDMGVTSEDGYFHGGTVTV